MKGFTTFMELKMALISNFGGGLESSESFLASSSNNFIMLTSLSLLPSK